MVRRGVQDFGYLAFTRSFVYAVRRWRQARLSDCHHVAVRRSRLFPTRPTGRRSRPHLLEPVALTLGFQKMKETSGTGLKALQA